MVNEFESFWLSDLLVIICLSGIVFCIFRCYFNFYMKDLRGIDVIPWGRQIEAMFSSSSTFRYVRAAKNAVGRNEFGSGGSGIIIGSSHDNGEDDSALDFEEGDTSHVVSSSYQDTGSSGRGLLDETDF